MKLRLISAAHASKCSGVPFYVAFKLQCRAVILLAVSALTLFADANTVNVMAQSPAPAPAATPANAVQKPDAPPAPPTGTIKGQLVSGDGQPLTNANVMAQGLTATPTAKPTRVDSEGRFVFEDLPAASYIIVGTAPGYIDQSTALGDVSKWPRHLIGSNVRVTMIRGGVITGRVTDAKGEPVVGVPVHAKLQNAQNSIANYFTGGGISETDDRGIYRIYGLLPGQYTVYAGGEALFGQFTPNGFDIDVPTYYPSATRDSAVPLSVRSGDETSGIDIRYQGLEGHTISGVVLGNVQPGTLGGAVTIFLGHAGSGSVLSLGIAALAEPRTFSFNGIADGEYELFANYLANQGDGAVVATKRVTVRGSDVTGVELSLAPLAAITGTIVLDPIKPEDKCDKRRSQLSETIPAAPRDEPKKSGNQSMIAMLSGGLGLVNEKGEFALRNLEAAKYRLEIQLPTESWYVRAINVPGAAGREQQLPNAPSTSTPVGNPNLNSWQGVVTLKPGEKLGGVSVMVGQDAANLRGRVETEGAIREGTRVHLVPADREQANNILRYSEALVKSNGSFALTNLAPGRYFILSRVEAPAGIDTSPRPAAWNPLARTKLRREAEAGKTIVELKPCEQMADYSLKPVPVQ